MSLSTYYDHSDPATALKATQSAPSILSRSSLIPSSLPWSIIGAAESAEEWGELEQAYYACLRSQDHQTAFQCLERIKQRFGKSNDRVIAMRGLYEEAVAKDDAELRQILQEYNKILEGNPMNIHLHKRRIALVRSMGREQDAILSLVSFLETFPTDTEGWCELSDLYQSQGMSAQAIFSLEEALVMVPNAWNLQARLGELNYIASQSGSDASETSSQYLADAIQRFARSIELCDDYLRGYYGLKLATDSALTVGKKLGPGMDAQKAQRLNDLASKKLKAIVDKWSRDKSVWSNEAEIIAAQALLNRQK